MRAVEGLMSGWANRHTAVFAYEFGSYIVDRLVLMSERGLGVMRVLFEMF